MLCDVTPLGIALLCPRVLVSADVALECSRCLRTRMNKGSNRHRCRLQQYGAFVVL